MDIVLFGKPGAGKGTQAPRIAAALGVPTVATGDVLRAAVREGTPMGREAKAFMDRGDLVPDEVILGIMKETLAKDEFTAGSLLDGVVRTTPQAEGMSRVLEEIGRRIDAVLMFDIDDEELVRRLSARTVCEQCQTPFTGREAGTKCAKCGGTLMRRKDDEPEAIRNRLAVYQRQTAPVLEWYRANGTPIATVNAVGSVDDVTRRALDSLAAVGIPGSAAR
ncbi:MAG: adenylate kinase [Geminicoccaceae bacterium]|nr:adenylate kinase [Geminicoccaceae bacterium]